MITQEGRNIGSTPHHRLDLFIQQETSLLEATISDTWEDFR